jgi:hypothetical protein
MSKLTTFDVLDVPFVKRTPDTPHVRMPQDLATRGRPRSVRSRRHARWVGRERRFTRDTGDAKPGSAARGGRYGWGRGGDLGRVSGRRALSRA